MTTPIELVSEFCSSFAKDHGRHAIKRWFTPNTLWSNVGIASTTGINEAIEFIEELEKSMGIATVHSEMLAIAADGNRVLTERLDIFVRADGSEIGRVTLMGIFEIEGDHIAAWRDYAHPNSMVMTAAS